MMRQAATAMHIPTHGCTWQGIYVFEHRRASHTCSLVLHLLGE